MGVLSNLKPQKVFYYFEKLCGIPHGSFHTKEISDFCVEFAKEHALAWHQDEAGNVIIVKEASPGYEAAPTVILQGHLDMVCEKEDDCSIDFEKDGLRLQVDKDLILAQGTTLGGDDGIAVAYALAILASEDLSHPRLEVVLTTDEEVGMLGAKAIDLAKLEGKTLINIDSEEEGIFLTSCAGGLQANMALPVGRTSAAGVCYEVALGGMEGGHSGSEIHQGRANANKLLGRLLYEVDKTTKLSIESMAGGQKDNAIPRTARASVLIEEGEGGKFQAKVKELEAIFQREHKVSDPNLAISVARLGKKKAMVLKESSKKKVFSMLVLIPDGVQAMSRELSGLVETSLNLGVMELGEEECRFSSAVRSSVGTAKAYLAETLQVLTETLGGSMEISGDYPAWEYQENSPIREAFTDAYRALFGAEPKIEAIHAGLECGLFSGGIPGLDCISLGPQMYGIHTTKERLSISSTERTWRLLLAVLERLK